MTNPGNGTLAARAIYKTDDIFHGPCRSLMPDIIINWDDNARVSTELLTAKYGLARSTAPGCALPPYYTGNHRPNAFMVSRGPDVLKGAIYEGASILDLAPTILSQLGIDPPGYMDGRVLSILRDRQAKVGTVCTRSVMPQDV
jgi:predicted AlkP superfamily phosphohydrolase/phosphomutase